MDSLCPGGPHLKEQAVLATMQDSGERMVVQQRSPPCVARGLSLVMLCHMPNCLLVFLLSFRSFFPLFKIFSIIFYNWLCCIF